MSGTRWIPSGGGGVVVERARQDTARCIAHARQRGYGLGIGGRAADREAAERIGGSRDAASVIVHGGAAWRQVPARTRADWPTDLDVLTRGRGAGVCARRRSATQPSRRRAI